ncbi:MAG: YsnF/AvaK domain-containing protein [Verrucomicrobiia bacterium]
MSIIAATLMLAGVTAIPAQQTEREQNASSSQNSQSRQSNSNQPASPQSGSGGEQKRSNSEQYIDYNVVNQQSEKIGTVEVVWEDQKGEPALLGVKRQDQEKLIILPAEQAEVNKAKRTVRVSLSSQAIASAPILPRDAELDQQTRQKAEALNTQQGQQSIAQPSQRSDARSGEQSDLQSSQQSTAQSSEEASASAGQVEQQDEATIRLKKEQATVDKRMIDAGGVLLRKVVRTETNRVPATLRHEEFVIERVPGDGQKTDSADFGERDIFIPLRREVPVVQKDTVLKETIRVGKDVQEQQTNVTTRLREEQLNIDEQGRTEGIGAPGGASSGSGAGSSLGRQQNDPAQESGQQQTDPNPEEK